MDWFKKSLQEQDDFERDKIEFCTLSQVGNDGGFDKGNCKKKPHYDGKVSESDDSFTDSFSHSFNHY